MKNTHTILTLSFVLLGTSILATPESTKAAGIAADPNSIERGYRHIGRTEEYKKPNRLVERKQRMHEAALIQAEIEEQQRSMVIKDLVQARIQKRKKESQFMFKSKNTNINLEQCSKIRIGARSGYCRQRLQYVTERGKIRDKYLEKNAPEVPGFTLDRQRLKSSAFVSPRNAKRKIQLMIDEGILEPEPEKVDIEEQEEEHPAAPVAPASTAEEIEKMQYNQSRIENPKFTVGEFPSLGIGGSYRAHTFEYGQYGDIYAYDTFIHVKGEDNNGKKSGVAAQLSKDSLPKDIVLKVATKHLDHQNFQIEYTVSNQYIYTKEATLFLFLDPDVLNEHGNGRKDTSIKTDETTMVYGWTGGGARDPMPDSYEANSPSMLTQNLQQGVLHNSNAFENAKKGDVALAIGFDLSLQPGRSKKVRILLSTNNSKIAQFALAHSDATVFDVLTVSGEVTE